MEKARRVIDCTEIGEVLKRLLSMPQSDQPYIVVYNKRDNHIVEGIKIDVSQSSIIRDGGKIMLVTQMLGGGRFDYVWYDEGQKPMQGQAELEKVVDWVEVCY